jgi:hypothetical protein
MEIDRYFLLILDGIYTFQKLIYAAILLKYNTTFIRAFHFLVSLDFPY